MKLSKLFKESRFVKANINNLKIGDYVYYDRGDYSKDIRYCNVTKIENRLGGNLCVWGKWTNDKNLKTGFNNNDTHTTSQVYIIR